MDPLLELIERIGTDDPPTDEELAEARGELVDLLDEATGGDTPDLESARALRQAIDQIDTEVTARGEAEEAARAEAAELRNGVVDGDDEGEGEEGAEGAEGSEGEEGEAEGAEAEPVAAAQLGRSIAAARQRVQANAEPPPTNPFVRMRAMGQAAGEEIGPDATLADVARIFTDHAHAVTSGRQKLIRSEVTYPEDRRLGEKLEDNLRLIESVTGPTALAAAGGICAPLPADFDHPIAGERGRPIRDALPAFNANRGGIRYAPSASLGDVADGITVWTEATDASPGESEKACLVVECEDELVAKVDAVVECLQIGNMQARFNPEFWRSRLVLLNIAHDRKAEQTLYAQLAGNATAVTYGDSHTYRDVLGAVDKAVAGISSRLRYRTTRFRAIFPAWLRQAIRVDLANQRLGSTPAESLNIADQVITGFFQSRMVDPVWSPDLDVFGAQSAGALEEFPDDDVDFLIFAEGDYLFLDGGTLDLGTEITDSVLNKTNDRQAFMETFEKGIQRRTGALEVTVPIAEGCACPNVLELTS